MKPEAPSRTSRRKLLATVFAAVSGAVLFHAPLLTAVATFMSVPDPLDRADCILVLYHEGDTVPFAAADLYRRGHASTVVIGRMMPSRLEGAGLLPVRDDMWRGALIAGGVPPDAIVTIGHRLTDEVDLGRRLAAYLSEQRKRTVIVVASAPASRLSRDDLRRGTAGRAELRMYPVPSREFNERSWWKTRHGWISYFDAYYLWFVRFVRS